MYTKRTQSQLIGLIVLGNDNLQFFLARDNLDPVRNWLLALKPSTIG